MKKKIIALALCLALIAGIVCLFAGCGDKQETIVVGYTIYKPMNYTEDGELVGFDTELAKAVFEGLGYKVVFKEIKWENKYTELEAGNIDCIWNGFTANVPDDDGVQRSEKVDFSYNYMENFQAVVVTKDSTIATLDDLNGLVGIAENGSAGQTYAESLKGVTFKGYTKQTDCLLEINAGGAADFAVVDVQLARSYVGKGDYSNLKIVEGLSSDAEYYAIGFKKGSDLTAKVNEQLEKLAKDGTIMKIAEKYDVAETVITDFSDQKK